MNDFQKLIRNLLWKGLSFLPKQEKTAVCRSFYGKGYSDSPKAIAEELRKRGWTVYWVTQGPLEAFGLPPGVIPIRDESAGAIYRQCRASVWVDNARKWSYTRKRGKTLYVQTWHGFPLKKIEADAQGALDEGYLLSAQQDSRMCDLMLSDSKFLTDLVHRAFWYGGEVLECGFPRNDVLFGPPEEATEKVRAALRIPEHKKLCLYAPTFRKDRGLSVYDLDYERLCRALTQRFGGEWLVLARLHPNIAAKAQEMHLNPRYVVNASQYPDIQDLYLASDVLVTDYSSVMFDYMLLKRPIFLYVNDQAAYRDDRGFYFDLGALPFPQASDNDRLEDKILYCDPEAQVNQAQAFWDKIGLSETGAATRRVADWLETKLQETR